MNRRRHDRRRALWVLEPPESLRWAQFLTDALLGGIVGALAYAVYVATWSWS